MSKWIFFTILSLVTLIGCNEQQLERIDQSVQDANNVAGGVQAVIESPAGQMIPPDLRIYGLLGVQLVSGLVIAWQEWRNQNMKKTTKAIVKGIEQSNNPEKITSATEVKSNIADEMMKQGGEKFYARANKIVDKLKIA